MNPVRTSLRSLLFALCAVALTLPRFATAGVFIVPHVLEAAGTINTTTYTYDTVLYFVYPAGQAGLPAGSGATVDLYLFDNSGDPMTGADNSTEVCNPCSYLLSDKQRKVTVLLDSLIAAAAGAAFGVKLGYALIVVSGADPDHVHVSGRLINGKTNAFDVDISSLDIQKVSFVEWIFADGFEFGLA